MTPEAGLQRLLLALSVRGDILRQAPDAVSPEVFGAGKTSPTPRQRLAGMVLKFRTQYPDTANVPPESLEQDVAEERKRLGPAEGEELSKELAAVLATEIPDDPTWIYDRAAKFADVKRIETTIEKARTALQASDPVQAVKAAREAMAAGAAREPMSAMRLVRASSIPMRKYRFVWPGRIPRRQLSLVAGNPGHGKTMTMIDAVARLTTGRPFPDEPGDASEREPVNTVFLTREDGVAETLMPRLLAAGGDPARMFVIESNSATSVGEDAMALEARIRDVGDVKFVVFDPLNDFIPKKTDRYAEVDVREALTTLNDLATRLDVGIVGIMHLNKKSDLDALQRMLGSVAYGAIVRVVHVVAPHPDDPGARVYVPAKFNIGRQPDGLKFKMGAQVNVGIDPDPDPLDDGRIWAAPIVWLDEPVTETANELLRAPAAERGRPPAKREQAIALIQQILANGPVPALDVQKRLRDAGVSEGTEERAKRWLNVKSDKIDGAWVWKLPPQIPLIEGVAGEGV
jgi:hypothetical protein